MVHASDHAADHVSTGAGPVLLSAAGAARLNEVPCPAVGRRAWATDPGELAAAIGPQTAVVLLMSPAMPTGAVLSGEHFDAIAGPVDRHGAWVIWDAAMERLVFGDSRPMHPGAHPDLASRTITVGSASKELRMIGWRVGWVVGPE